MSDLMEKITALCKRRGFIFPGSEIYGGFGGFWDYGPLGVELKNNLKKEWWKSMVYQRDDMVGLDAAIIMNPQVWEASGHTKHFSDMMIECKVCNKRFRVDKIPGAIIYKEYIKIPSNTPCPSGGHDFEGDYLRILSKGEKEYKPRDFNLLVETYFGVVDKTKAYLRGEITQGVFVNFKNVVSSTRIKIPFGIAQIGKAFRNEITPGNFTFRSREFEQMELEYFIKPEEKEGEQIFNYWKEQRLNWYLSLGIKKENLRFREHAPDERAHYARKAEDIEYQAPFGWSEFEGIHHRGDFDLGNHKLTYKDETTGEEYTPWVIETSGGVDRATLFLLIDAYHEDNGRVVLKINPKLAPYKVAVFPLLANKPELIKAARDIYSELRTQFYVAWDDRGNIGKRYFAQDEIGTPWCVTVDFETLKDQAVTVRDRDTTKQERVKIDLLKEYFLKKLEG
ncbi:MAG: glycine--tRNA ligase [Patescibacteria group bacterium]|nr:glycine--tRNA ligase [Patescibacteria group bacterium]MCL5095128.1 glycine--tRNA ligase [Patescibacteria group bacterium]